jgi:predicted nucleotide-binding protein
MTYYHVRISTNGQSHDETKLDLDLDNLEKQILTPYRSGLPITINGRSIPMDSVNRIRINASKQASEYLLRLVEQDRANSHVAVIGGPSNKWRAAAKAEDVTDQYITGPPGQAEVILPSKDTQGPGDQKSVFLVAGRDNRVITEFVYFLRALDLRVVEWEHAVAQTGLPNPYVGQVIVAGMTMADATVVLFTPDDIVRLRADLLRDDDSIVESNETGQARPNVFYEAGIADTYGLQRTVLVEVGKVKPFSDIVGRHVVKFDGSFAMRNSLAGRLRNAGLAVDTTGNNWTSAGDFTVI